MSLAEDGPPVCPACEKVIMPTWAFCASCGAALDDEPAPDPDPVEEPTLTEPPWDLPLNHRNLDHLDWAYKNRDSIAAAAELFSATYHTVRQAMIDLGIHEPDSYD